MDIGIKNKEIIEKIKTIELQITSLSEEKIKLISELNTLPHNNLPSSLHPIESPITEQINLFRSLFRVREDVYARLWTSKKTGKSGYSPVCKNEWSKGICRKPTVKCSECPNRELSLLTDDVICKHLQGNHTVGIYPLFPDETSCFLAVDFDGEGWQENVFAFKETCFEHNVPAAVERSRSGNGAHAWIFFAENIPAMIARKMGSFLITETMSKRYQLDMKSYDRLFPNQDTLPKGGFGNLIVLPFQKEALKKGNSVFIDENANPYNDQWQFLSTLRKMPLSEVENISQEASKNGQVIGVRMSPLDEDDPPWLKLPSGKIRYKPVIKGLPEKVELVIANRIYIKVGSLPSVLLNQIKRLAAFQNPEFYKRQGMRLSTSFTPRVICCSEVADSYLSLPRGCINDLVFLLTEYGVKFNLKDERISGHQTNFEFQGSLNKEQKLAVNKILENEIGVLVAPPGSGKTVIGVNIIAVRKTNTLILTHRKPLLDQWRMQLAAFLDIDLKDLGQIGGGKNNPNGILDVGLIQSLERKGLVDDRVADYGFIIMDECHHVSAVSFERVLMQAKAKYVLGLTATPYRRDGHQPIIYMQCGPIIHRLTGNENNQQVTNFTVIPKVTKFTYEWQDDSKIYDLWPKLVNDEQRNQIIIDDIIKTVETGRFPIILTERKEHLETLAAKLQGAIECLITLSGSLKTKKRKELLQTLAQYPDDKKKAILATGAYIGEGFDEPRLDTLFITMPISFKGKVVQYAGRLHREHQTKKDAQIYDYWDKEVSVLSRMYQKRLKTYKSLGYEIQNTSTAQTELL